MKIKKGDYVTRKSYDNDTVFIVLNVSSDTYFLKGVDVRLYADSNKEDLVKVNKPKENDDFVLYRYATEQTKGTKFTSLLLQFHSTPYPFRLFGTICQSLLKRHCSPSSRSRNSIYLKAVFPSGFHGKRSSTGRC